MPSTRRNNRPAPGPGRGRSRTRAGARPAPLRTTDPDAAAEDLAGKSRGGFTRRAIALIVVLVLLLISYATSLRIWVTTEQDNATNRAAIEQSQQRINELNAELARWDNPDYVRAQARQRLGWVMPEEKGYSVLDADGNPMATHLTVSVEDPGAPVPQEWWQRVWRSLEVADRPAPSPGAAGSATQSPKPPLTDGTRTPTPTAKPTPRRTPTATPTPPRSPTATPRAER